jgi:hypothetical protein
MQTVHSLASLDSWSSARWSEGIQLDELRELDALTVRTQHSVYELIVLEAEQGRVLVRGGRHFPAFTEACLMGSSAGGNFLKQLGIYRGLKVEFLVDDRHIVTSPVETAHVLPPLRA